VKTLDPQSNPTHNPIVTPYNQQQTLRNKEDNSGALFHRNIMTAVSKTPVVSGEVLAWLSVWSEVQT